MISRGSCSTSWQRIRTQHSTNEVLMLGLPIEIHNLPLIEAPQENTERLIQDTLGSERKQSLTSLPSVVLQFWGPIFAHIVIFPLCSFSLIIKNTHLFLPNFNDSLGVVCASNRGSKHIRYGTSLCVFFTVFGSPGRQIWRHEGSNSPGNETK